ncbi:SDR family NAD(P)-dependent oxidoreductase [Thalassorhabdus alkalitolerans]|uniref:SDR family NAD(P)-dependent oxidoreductase n=1 Tax=Thalassorhabdus alkalitolerans TaxID=2282697 RepID=A0ABW0YNH4_9BACI|nr:SDR family oxidoreductase [Thalassobacillus sp. C254]
MKNKVIVITGASSGLGAWIARAAARKGAKELVLIARSEDKLLALKEEIIKLGGNAMVLPGDITETEQVIKGIEKILREKGHIDVLINNAGYGLFEKVIDTPIEDIQGMFAVNAVGLIQMTRAVLPSMTARKQGHIINISSQAGKIATPKSAVYSATKHAVLGFTNSLRMEVEDDGIIVSAVNPGPIKTPFFEKADKQGTYEKNVEKFMLSPDKVARKTLKLIKKPKREMNLPLWMNAGAKIYGVAPRLLERAAGKQFKQK